MVKVETLQLSKIAERRVDVEELLRSGACKEITRSFPT
jgi:hypothetical protein